MVKEEAKNEKETFFRICWSGDGQKREKGRFSEYVGQLMVKDADFQEIVTKSSRSEMLVM